MTHETVRLEQVWQWECPRCATVQAVSMVVAELDEDTKLEMMVDHGIYGAKTGEFVTCPSVVECEQCSAEFSVETRSD